MEGSQIKCGYCSWWIAYQCENILQHECFREYDENTNALNIDENNVATIVSKFDEDELSSQSSNIDLDERLIMAIIDRPPLYDYRLNIKERSRAKKAALWEEVKNIIDSNISVKELQKKWKYHRDCYIRARRKIKQYVPSGSSASSANEKPGYRFFELMKVLDDTLSITPTISTLSKTTEEILSSLEKESNVLSDCSDVESQICSQPSSSCLSSDLSSLESTSTSSIKKRRKDQSQQSQQLQAAVLDILKTPIAEIDAVDGFLKTLGEALRRLPYQKRITLEIKFLEMTTAAEFEDKEER